MFRLFRQPTRFSMPAAQPLRLGWLCWASNLLCVPLRSMAILDERKPREGRLRGREFLSTRQDPMPSSTRETTGETRALVGLVGQGRDGGVAGQGQGHRPLAWTCSLVHGSLIHGTADCATDMT